MGTDSLYLTLAEEELYDCFRTDKKREWIDFRSGLCRRIQSQCNDKFLSPYVLHKTQQT